MYFIIKSFLNTNFLQQNDFFHHKPHLPSFLLPCCDEDDVLNAWGGCGNPFTTCEMDKFAGRGGNAGGTWWWWWLIMEKEVFWLVSDDDDDGDDDDMFGGEFPVVEVCCRFSLIGRPTVFWGDETRSALVVGIELLVGVWCSAVAHGGVTFKISKLVEVCTCSFLLSDAVSDSAFKLSSFLSSWASAVSEIVGHVSEQGDESSSSNFIVGGGVIFWLLGLTAILIRNAYLPMQSRLDVPKKETKWHMKLK